jgi:hypothetical protein
MNGLVLKRIAILIHFRGPFGTNTLMLSWTLYKMEDAILLLISIRKVLEFFLPRIVVCW